MTPPVRRHAPSWPTAPRAQAARCASALALALAVLSPGPGRAQAPAAPAGTAAEGRIALQSVSVGTAGAGTAALRLELDRPLAGPPTGFTQAQPPRVAIDLPGVRNALGRRLCASIGEAEPGAAGQMGSIRA